MHDSINKGKWMQFIMQASYETLNNEKSHAVGRAESGLLKAQVLRRLCLRVHALLSASSAPLAVHDDRF